MNQQLWRELLSALNKDELTESERKALFRAPTKPSRAATEFFISKVMGRIEKENAPAGLWPWLVPALGAGFAVLLFSIAVPVPEAVAPADVLFLVGSHEPAVGQLLAASDLSGSDDMTAFVMGEK